MADLAQFKQKYASVLDLVKKKNVRLDHLHVQDGKLFMQGAAHDQDVKNAIWNEIKHVDPVYADITVDLGIDPSLPPPPPLLHAVTTFE